jgi:hypothetical protein
MTTNNRMIKTCNFFLVPAMNTDKERGGTAPLILNVSKCDAMIVRRKMEEIQKEDFM